MEIKLIRTFIRNLRLSPAPEEAEIAQKLTFGPVYQEGREKEFAVAYKLIAPLEPGAFVMDIEFTAVFETNEAITEDFKKSHFPRVNAAAVGYPYLRAFVSQFAVLSGFNNLTLPVRNFVKEQQAASSPPPATP